MIVLPFFAGMILCFSQIHHPRTPQTTRATRLCHLLFWSKSRWWPADHPSMLPGGNFSQHILRQNLHSMLGALKYVSYYPGTWEWNSLVPSFDGSQRILDPDVQEDAHEPFFKSSLVKYTYVSKHAIVGLWMIKHFDHLILPSLRVGNSENQWDWKMIHVLLKPFPVSGKKFVRFRGVGWLMMCTTTWNQFGWDSTTGCFVCILQALALATFDTRLETG